MSRLILVFASFIFVTGCVASPLDILIPARSPSEATTEYLGHLYQTNSVNGLYYSVSDAKLNKALVPIRKMELQGLYFAAKGETELLEFAGSALSNGIWGGLMIAAGAMGLAIPKPGTKALIEKAKAEDPKG